MPPDVVAVGVNRIGTVPLFTGNNNIRQSAKRAALIIAVFLCSGMIAFAVGVMIQ